MGKIFASLDPFFEPGEIMGRSTANQGFIKALMLKDPFEAYHFFASGGRAAGRLARKLEKEFPVQAAGGSIKVMERSELPRALGEIDYHCFHLSDCINYPAWLAALRNKTGREIFPITAVTHSLSYSGYGRAFLAHLWPGTTARDCVVATSRAAAAVVGNFYRMLRQGYGLDPELYPEPAIERIPLGVDVSAMNPPGEEERERARRNIGAGQDETVLLVFGRISHHSKMDLLPLFRVVQRLYARGVKASELRLVLGGWCEEKERMLRVCGELASNMGLKLTIRPRPEEEEKRELFTAADIFVSPVDNPQETFGVSVAEAGAFGLPVAASDYDGYRDIVVHGETGFLAPARSASMTGDVDALAPLVFDTFTHLRLAQRTCVDVPALAEAILALIRDPELRGEMGRAARARVEREFSWSGVIEKHLALWDDLWSRPVDAKAAKCWRHPLAPGYGSLFQGHPTAGLKREDVLVATDAGNAVYRGRDHVLIYEGLADVVSMDSVKRLLFASRKPQTAGELLKALAAGLGMSGESAEAVLLWALKHDLLEVVGGEG